MIITDVETRSNPYYELRQRALEIRTGVVKLPHSPEVRFGVLMEFAVEKGRVRLVSLVDGTTSLYFSRGGGIIGGGAH